MLIGAHKMTLLEKYDHICEVIDDLKLQLQPHDTGHIHTAISVLETEKQKLHEKITLLIGAA